MDDLDDDRFAPLTESELAAVPAFDDAAHFRHGEFGAEEFLRGVFDGLLGFAESEAVFSRGGLAMTSDTRLE